MPRSLYSSSWPTTGQCGYITAQPSRLWVGQPFWYQVCFREPHGMRLKITSSWTHISAEFLPLPCPFPLLPSGSSWEHVFNNALAQGSPLRLCSGELTYDSSYGLSLSSKYILICFAKYYMGSHLKRVRWFTVQSVALIQRTFTYFFSALVVWDTWHCSWIWLHKNQDFSSHAHVFTLKEWF